jgi:hypothetical protein
VTAASTDVTLVNRKSELQQYLDTVPAVEFAKRQVEFFSAWYDLALDDSTPELTVRIASTLHDIIDNHSANGFAERDLYELGRTLMSVAGDHPIDAMIDQDSLEHLKLWRRDWIIRSGRGTIPVEIPAHLVEAQFRPWSAKKFHPAFIELINDSYTAQLEFMGLARDSRYAYDVNFFTRKIHSLLVVDGFKSLKLNPKPPEKRIHELVSIARAFIDIIKLCKEHNSLTNPIDLNSVRATWNCFDKFVSGDHFLSFDLIFASLIDIQQHIRNRTPFGREECNVYEGFY